MKVQTVVLLAIVIIGALLRLWQIGESFWVDELHTSWVATGSITEVAERAALGNQSPLYFWLAWFFARLPLSPELTLRLPSLLAGCALPVAIYWLARKLARSKKEEPDDVAPLLAAALVAIDPLAIFYSQEARPYAFLLLTVVIHFGLLLQVLDRPATWPRVGWVLTGALLVHWHYTGGLILAAECMALVVLAILSKTDSGQQQTCGDTSEVVAMCYSCWIDLGALALLILPAIPGVLAVAERRDNWNQMVEPQDAIEILQMFPWTPAVIVLLVLKPWRPVAAQRSLILLAGWLLVPLCLTWISTQTELAALFYKRYLIAVLPASILAAALCVRLGTNLATRASIAAVILVISLANGGLVVNWLDDGRLLHDRKEDWRGAIHELNSKLEKSSAESTLVLLRSGLIEADELPANNAPQFLEYCIYPVRGAYSIRSEVDCYPLTTTGPGQHLQPAAKARLRSSSIPSLWLLGRGSDATREQTLHELQQSGEGEEMWVPQPPHSFGTVFLQEVRLRED